MEKDIYIWVEGQDDIRFFEKIIKPIFEEKYRSVKITTYSRTKKDIILKYIEAIKLMSADYFFTSDIDDTICVTLKKQSLTEIYNNLDQEKIIIIIKEIESWYKAGLDDNKCQQFNIPIHSNTDNLIKEDFNRLIPNGFSRLGFMLEILECFSIESAVNKNGSFKYFIEKYNC